MKDPHKHVEKTPVPGFGQVATADLISRAFGIAPDLPKTVGTGCGKRRQLSDTTTVPEHVTCLACADYGRAEQIRAAGNAEALLSLGDEKLASVASPGKPALTMAQLQQIADEHRAMAARYPRATLSGPVKITLSMPRSSPGEAQIRAKGKNLDLIVGDCVRSGRQWRATLWSRPGQHTPGDPFTFGTSLHEIRDEQLQPQIDREGPWWHC
jgi:hypothetical protein